MSFIMGFQTCEYRLTNFKMYMEYLGGTFNIYMTNIILNWVFNVTNQRRHHGVNQSKLALFFFKKTTGGNCK